MIILKYILDIMEEMHKEKPNMTIREIVLYDV
jgi:hypothetical protein